MKRRTLLFGVVVALLAFLNAWRWIAGTSGAPPGDGADAQALRADDLVLHVASLQQYPGAAERDLFRPPTPAPAPRPTTALPAGALPPKSAEELALEAARAEFEQIRLIGVAFRNGKGQAYLVRGGETWLVEPGDTVASRFRVETIRADAVEISDPVTRVGGEIRLSGS